MKHYFKLHAHNLSRNTAHLINQMLGLCVDYPEYWTRLKEPHRGDYTFVCNIDEVGYSDYIEIASTALSLAAHVSKNGDRRFISTIETRSYSTSLQVSFEFHDDVNENDIVDWDENWIENDAVDSPEW